MTNNNYNKWYFVLAMFAVISMFFGGSLAYWQWTTNTEQRTSITLTVAENFRCDADGGGSISSGEKYLVPSDCTNQDYAIQKTISVSPTIYGDSSITMDLWLDVKSIGSGLANSDNFKYALTTDSNSCTNGVVKSGSFKGRKANDKVELFSYMGYNQTTTDTYYLYVWLDKEETNSNTMNQNFSLSLNGTCTDAPEPATYIVYNEEDTTLRLYKRDGNVSGVSNNKNKNKNIVSTLDNRMDNYNIDKIDDLTITDEDKITFDLENTTYSNANQLPWYEYRESITRVIFEDEIKPKSMNYWFSGMSNVEYIDVSKIDTIRITSMNGMFSEVGINVTDTFEIVGLDNWNVENVTNMSSMFASSGYNAKNWNIGDLSGWNVSNVTSMSTMFAYAGYSSTSWRLNLSYWKLSKDINVYRMFRYAGCNSNIFELDLTNWDVSNVINMHRMFASAGNNAINLKIIGLSEWDVSNVSDMSFMFNSAGINSTSWDIGNLSEWDVSKVTNMAYMFSGAGSGATSLNIGNLSSWDVSNVTSLYAMFEYFGQNVTNFSIMGLSGWNVSNVTSMGRMFSCAGEFATTWNIEGLTNWNVSNVTDMEYMFASAGKKATYNLDLSGWNVSNVTNYGSFNSGVTNKITSPVWVN